VITETVRDGVASRIGNRDRIPDTHERRLPQRYFSPLLILLKNPHSRFDVQDELKAVEFIENSPYMLRLVEEESEGF